MDPHSLKLFPLSDLLESIKEYSLSNNLYGFVSGVVGNLSSACIQCPGNQKINKFDGNLEIVSLNGVFNNGQVHLHLSFADEGCNVYGGHLEEGCKVKNGADIFLLSFEKKIVNINDETLNKSEVRIKVYILKNCPWSKRAIRLLNSAKIPHQVILIENDADFSKVSSISNQKTFPQIFIDNSFLGGYEELSNKINIDSIDSFK